MTSPAPMPPTTPHNPATAATAKPSAPAAPATSTSAPMSALVRLQQRSDWQHTNPAMKVVLQRIAVQRDQRMLLRLERAQQHALKAQQPGQVDADAPLHQRAAAFARLHPTVTATLAASLAMMIGPRRLARVARSSLPTLLPLLAKLKR